MQDLPEGAEDAFSLAKVQVSPDTPGILMRGPQSVYSPWHGTEHIWGPRRMEYTNLDQRNADPLNPYAPDDELEGQISRELQGVYKPRSEQQYTGDIEARMRQIEDVLRQLDSRPDDPMVQQEALDILEEL